MPNNIPTQIKPVDAPRQFDAPQLGIAFVEVDRLIRASEARDVFDVDGSGQTVAVLDTGLNTQHVDFTGRIMTQKNFTGDNHADPDDATDGQGHGTNVGGIIVANGDHIGVAPGAGIIPLKVLDDTGGGSFDAILEALQWVIDHREDHNITAVCMSLGASDNQVDDSGLSDDPMVARIETLRNANVVVSIAAGNDFFKHNSQQGMSYPAIIRQCISVGAVYDEFEGDFSYGSGAQAFSSGPDRITPFSQRLHASVSPNCATNIFAPGAPVTSSGIGGTNGESIQHGTSQATPVTVGVLLLMQQYHLRLTGQLPTVDILIGLMQQSAVTIHDGDDENDNVANTELDYLRLDAFAALDAIRRHVQKVLLRDGTPV